MKFHPYKIKFYEPNNELQFIEVTNQNDIGYDTKPLIEQTFPTGRIARLGDIYYYDGINRYFLIGLNYANQNAANLCMYILSEINDELVFSIQNKLSLTDLPEKMYQFVGNIFLHELPVKLGEYLEISTISTTPSLLKETTTFRKSDFYKIISTKIWLDDDSFVYKAFEVQSKMNHWQYKKDLFYLLELNEGEFDIKIDILFDGSYEMPKMFEQDCPESYTGALFILSDESHYFFVGINDRNEVVCYSEDKVINFKEMQLDSLNSYNTFYDKEGSVYIKNYLKII